MTEKQKMLRGEFYNPRDPELLEDYNRARHLLRALSQLDSRALDQRIALFRDLLGHAGDGAWIELPFSCEYGRHITIGNNTTIGAGSVVTKDIPDNVLAFGNPCRLIRSVSPSNPAH